MITYRIPARTIDHSRLVKVGEGGERIIYRSDEYPDLVFKLQKRPDAREFKRWDLKSALLRFWPGFHNYSVLLEYKTYVRGCLFHPQPLDTLPIAKIFGFVSSAEGVLQVCEKVSLDGKDVGPSLRALVRQGDLSPADVTALTRFAQQMLASNLPMHDVNSSNVVKGADTEGGVRFVLIDGLGDLSLIPLRRYFRAARRKHLIRSFTRFEKFGLDFDPATFAFSAKKAP